MAVSGLVNESELRKAIEQLHPDGELFEVRIIPNDRRRKPASGYFRDADTLIRGFKTFDLRNANVYITLNAIDDALFSRQQSEHFVAGANTTGDNDVIGYKWLFIDIDPVRPSGISSSDDELKKSFEVVRRIVTYLSNNGFEEPVKAVSGNGSHLLYRVNIKSDEKAKALIKRFLTVISMLFDSDDVQMKVDTSNYNPSRVCKLYGTMAQKGTNTKERPFRMSRILEELKNVRATDIQYVKKIADQLPDEKPQPASRYNGYNPKAFDVETWMAKYGIHHSGAKTFRDGTKYILDHCPFNHDHKSPDSMITVAPSGAIGFKCLHNSCSDKRWQDVRLLFEPNAYEKNDTDRRIEEGWARHNREKQEAKEQEVRRDDEKTEKPIPAFETAPEILDREDPDPEYVKSGVRELDVTMLGLEKGKISVLSGLRASAKSTLLGQIILNAVDDDHTVVCYSGELSDKSFLNWLMLQAAGKGNVEQSVKFRNIFYVKKELEKKIADWLGERLWLWNNQKKTDLGNMMSWIENKAAETKADLIVIDNLMALDVSGENRVSEMGAQTRFVWLLKDIAAKTNTHVILVAHPRKADGLLRIEDISGTGNITNIADNCFIIHRWNKDFESKAPVAIGKQEFGELKSTRCTNVLEISKERSFGTSDVFIPLYFERESKRLKNTPYESFQYGWKDDGFEEVKDLSEIPF